MSKAIMALLYQAGKNDANAMRADDARMRRIYAELAGKNIGLAYKLLLGDLYIGQHLHVRIKARCKEYGLATRHVVAEVFDITPEGFCVKLLPQYAERYNMEGWKWIFFHGSNIDISQSMVLDWFQYQGEVLKLRHRAD